MKSRHFFDRGWIKFEFDSILASWVDHALPVARTTIASPEHRQWLRCGGTWFAGVNVLSNDARGAVADGPQLAGAAIEFIRGELSLNPDWDSAQISVCYPGYPRPMDSETKAAFRYRLKRDAAHVDGLLPEGRQRRRHLREYHGFILGIPLTQASPQASPLVVWEGSHEIIRHEFKQMFNDLAPDEWGNVDVTDMYVNTRRRIFDECKRIEVFAEPGEAYIIHRLALHGVAPWADNATAAADGRMICYFRPQLNSPQLWLDCP